MTIDELIAKIQEHFGGIDKTDNEGGYWQTQDGAKAGKIILRNLQKMLRENWPDHTPAPPAAAGEVKDLTAALRFDAECAEADQYDLCKMTANQMRRTAALLEQLSGEWHYVASIAQDMRARGIAEQVAGDELLKAANRNWAIPNIPTTNPARHLERMEEIGAMPESELAPRIARAAELLRQQGAAPAPSSGGVKELVEWLYETGRLLNRRPDIQCRVDLRSFDRAAELLLDLSAAIQEESDA